MLRRSMRLQTSETPWTAQTSPTEPASLFQLLDLNDDCLIHILELLDLIDLENMCQINERFHEIIVRHIIPVRTIAFSKFDDVNDKNFVRHLFCRFGKSMTRLEIDSDYPEYLTFIELLLLLIRYCEPGRLKVVTITFGIGTPKHIPIELLTEIAPYFKNVHTLHINYMDRKAYKTGASFMHAIDKQNVRSLHVFNDHEMDLWLTAEITVGFRQLDIAKVEKITVGFRAAHVQSNNRSIHFEKVNAVD